MTGLKKAAVLAILQSERGLLLLHRNKDPHFGKYIPIGGKVDPYESPRETAIREIHEEAGLEVGELRLAGILIETSPVDYNWISSIYTATVPYSDPIECKEGRLEWIMPDQIATLPTPPTDRFIYEYVLRGEFFVFDAYFNAELELLRMVNEVDGDSVFPLPHV